MGKYAELLDRCKFNDQGLMTAIAQDKANGQVLMVGFMNRKALEQTSGHLQKIKELYFDCDMDAILMLVEQLGGACHHGYRSCFYRRVNPEGKLEVVGEKVFDEEDVYGKD